MHSCHNNRPAKLFLPNFIKLLLIPLTANCFFLAAYRLPPTGVSVPSCGPNSKARACARRARRAEGRGGGVALVGGGGAGPRLPVGPGVVLQLPLPLVAHRPVFGLRRGQLAVPHG